MTKCDITAMLHHFLHDKFCVDKSLLTDAHVDAPLTGRSFNLTGRDLVYLLAFVQDSFQIEIPGIALADDGFNSIASIVRIVTQTLAAKETA